MIHAKMQEENENNVGVAITESLRAQKNTHE